MLRAALFSCLAIILLANSCAPGPGNQPSNNRIIHCKIVVDKSFYFGHDTWKDNIPKLMRRLSVDFEEWYEISFVTDTVILWDNDVRECARSGLMQCVLDSISRNNQDVVVHFYRGTGYLPDEIIGLTRPDWAYIAVTQLDDVNIDMPFQLLYNTLYHEMCHLFGAVHVSSRRNQIYLMEPAVNGELITKTGKELVMRETKMDKANETLIRGMAGRPLYRSAVWPDTLWPSIRQLYHGLLAEYNQEHYDSRGLLVESSDDFLVRPDVYFMLSNFASMCGRDTIALSYVDSTDRFWRAQILGNDALKIADAEAWKLFRKNACCYRKAIILLRARRFEEAETQMAELNRNAKRMPKVNWKPLVELYEWERRIRNNEPAESFSN